MNTTRIAALMVALGLVLMGASECNIGGKPTNVTCEVTARDTTTLTLTCKNRDGSPADGGGKKNIPSDLYPKCQVSTFWPGCKGK